MMDLSSVTDATIALLGAVAIVMAAIGILSSVSLTPPAVSVEKVPGVNTKEHLHDSKAA